MLRKLGQIFTPNNQEASSSNSSNSNSTKTTYKYDIFLSFRGEDTRKGFTDHLHHALTKSGFRVFIDDEELERGEVISKELQRAIENSRFAIIVLSKNYAFSSWCLNELQYILYSRDNSCQQVFPIFYDVEASDVRHQRGSFAEAFDRHQMLQRDTNIMKSWRDSLTEVANLSGWDCKDRYEAKLIDTVVEELWSKLHDGLRPYSEELIGIDNQVQLLEPLLRIGLNDVRFVGIWGLPGIGKTTISRAIFKRYRSQFDVSCFLHNVRATSLERDGEVQLQSKLLSHLKIKNLKIENMYDGKEIIQNRFRDKKVLLILDDVSHTSHLEYLANSPSWFGGGSRVIITTRNLDLLLRQVHKVYVHEVKTMKPHESLQLFCQKAFGKAEPHKDLMEVSKTVCRYANGLPLALSILGSHFCGRRSVSEWQDTLDMLRNDPHNDIFTILKVSFDALTDTEQTVFLDIACFFNGWRKKVITQMMESCGFNAQILTTLHRKSMLREFDDCLVVHDFLEQMGRRIVIDESLNDVGYRSRLWSKKDIDVVMENNLGTKEIQCMVSLESYEVRWCSEAFSNLRSLRLLMVSSSDFDLPGGLKCLSHSLKVLHWTKYPLANLPYRTRLYNLVDLKMHHSKLKKLWNKSLCSENLKFLDLSYSKNLTETPDFSELPNLERVELEGCECLIDLHASVGQHKKLQVLNLKGCKNLRALGPKILEMNALEELVLCGCIKVYCLPEFGEGMENLERLDAGETSLAELPESLGLLTSLKTLKLRSCKNLVCLPQTIHNLKNLEWLDAEETSLAELPESLGLLTSLKTLKLRSCKNLVCLPQTIHNLKRLVAIDVSGCSNFTRFPEKLNEIEALEELDASETNIIEVPSSIGGLRNVRKLSFHGCEHSISNSWKSSWSWPVDLIHEGLTLHTSLWRIKSLKELDLSCCSIGDESIPDDFGGLSSLERLNLRGNKFKNLLPDCISDLSNLEFLCLNSCSELQSLPQPPPSLRALDAGECVSLERMASPQLRHFFHSIVQVERPMRRSYQTLAVTIPGSEIPSWFENQKVVCLDEEGEALVMVDMPNWEEILGIVLCIVLDDKFYSTEPEKVKLGSPWWFFGVAAISPPDGSLLMLQGSGRTYEKEIKSCHLWMVFWKPRSEELKEILEFWMHGQIPFRLFYDRIEELDGNVSIKCGWHLIRRQEPSPLPRSFSTTHLYRNRYSFRRAY